jgi:hypothetical protein
VEEVNEEVSGPRANLRARKDKVALKGRDNEENAVVLLKTSRALVRT